MFTIGDTFTGIAEYETPGNNIGGGKRNAIYNSLNGVTISYPEYQFNSYNKPDDNGSIKVTNGKRKDKFNINDMYIADNVEQEFSLSFKDYSGDVFDNTLLPLTLNGNDFNIKTIRQSFTDLYGNTLFIYSDVEYANTINSPIPEPTTLLLLGLGLMCMAKMGRLNQINT